MPGHALRLLSLALCLIVAVSFGLFAGDQAGIGSRHARAGEGDPTVVATTTAQGAAPDAHGPRARSTPPPAPAGPVRLGRPGGQRPLAHPDVPDGARAPRLRLRAGYLARFTNGRAT